MSTKILIILQWTIKSHGEGKKSYIKTDNLSNLCIFNMQKLEGLLMDQHILYMLFFA
jgi:hypothetical protein